MFEGRLPKAMADRAPHIVDTADGREIWTFEDIEYSQVGMNAMAGRRPETVHFEPSRFSDMRPGCYDIDARIKDMDINGVWASLNFPSMITGFCGRVFSQAKDPALGLAVTKAWNDWFYEEWWQPLSRAHHPARHHLPDRPRRGGQGDLPQRRARLQGHHAAGAAAPHRHAVAVHRLLGSDRRRLRGDRHGDLPARRLVRRLRARRGIAAAAARGHHVRLAQPGRLRRVALVGLCGQAPQPEDRHERGWHRLGRHAARPVGQHR